MEIIIHRGIDQIGGCITEIRTDTTRILIDLGQNLPDNQGRVNDPFADKEKIELLTRHIDAIFYTHYHGDHLGHFVAVPRHIPQYIGQTARKVALCKAGRLSLIPGRETISGEEISYLNRMIPFTPAQPIQTGNIRVTPYFVSHSAYDSYMFLIEADGTRILHTGDFREHGYLGKGLFPTIREQILRKGPVDYLVTEGTMLSRLDERVRHEWELMADVKEIMKKYKYVFVLCSSTDMERLATYYAANKTFGKRPFVCDDYQKNILKIFSESAGTHSSLFNFEQVYSFGTGNEKLINWMKQEGCCMLVRPTAKYAGYWECLRSQLRPEEAVLIYSMWKEYVRPGSKHAKTEYVDFINRFPLVKYIHTSGHASAECLAAVCNLVNPVCGIIPIHSENSNEYNKLPIREELKRKIILSFS
ncbi:MAG: MBL fold metallo-hydrolase [Tannerellaceae bacterium]|nr:MBL fold metallo-hydrolase [Tannerellaceae bacterium]